MSYDDPSTGQLIGMVFMIIADIVVVGYFLVTWTCEALT